MLSNRYQTVMEMLSKTIDKWVATMEKSDSVHKGTQTKEKANGY